MSAALAAPFERLSAEGRPASLADVRRVPAAVRLAMVSVKH